MPIGWSVTHVFQEAEKSYFLNGHASLQSRTSILPNQMGMDGFVPSPIKILVDNYVPP